MLTEICHWAHLSVQVSLYNSFLFSVTTVINNILPIVYIRLHSQYSVVLYMYVCMYDNSTCIGKINECTLLLLIVRDKTSGEDGCGVGSN